MPARFTVQLTPSCQRDLESAKRAAISPACWGVKAREYKGIQFHSDRRIPPACWGILQSLPISAQKKVLEAIRRLETNPFGPPPKIKKLKGKGVGRWRLEVWPHRVRYDVVGQNAVLYRVRHRKQIYQE